MSGFIDANYTEILDHLRQLFHRCDCNDTGYVHASDLLERSRSRGIFGDASRKELEELSRFLDPSRDNRLVTVDDFISSVSKWVNMLQTQDEDKVSVTEEQLSSPTFVKALKSGSFSNDISVDQMNPVSDLESEILSLNSMIKQLTQEKTVLAQKFNIMEDQCQQLEIENERLHQELKNAKGDIMNLTDQIEEYRECQLEHSKVEALDPESNGLENGNDALSLQKKIQELQLALEEARDANIANEAVMSPSKNSLLRKLIMEKEEIVEANRRLLKTVQSLKTMLQESKENEKHLAVSLDSVQTDLKEKEKILEDMLISRGSLLENSIDLSYDNIDGASGDDEMWERLNASMHFHEGPSSTSKVIFHALGATKESRSSIGDEIKELGVTELPFCEKTVAEITANTEQCSVLTQPTVTTTDTGTQTIINEEYVENSSSKSIFATVLYIFGASFALILFCLLFGRFEINGKTIYPIKWPFHWGLPKPLLLFEYKVQRDPLIW